MFRPDMAFLRTDPFGRNEIVRVDGTENSETQDEES